MRTVLAGLAVILLVLPAASAAEKRAVKASFKPSKADLAASYRPHRVHGVDWYSRIGAARAKEKRLRREEGQERLILQMRMLGPMDGAT